MLSTIFLASIEPDAQSPVLSTVAWLLCQLRTLLQNMNKVPGLHGNPTSPESMLWRAQRAMSSNTKLTMALLPYWGSYSSSAGTWTWFCQLCSQLSCPISLRSSTELGIGCQCIPQTNFFIYLLHIPRLVGMGVFCVYVGGDLQKQKWKFTGSEQLSWVRTSSSNLSSNLLAVGLGLLN